MFDHIIKYSKIKYYCCFKYFKGRRSLLFLKYFISRCQLRYPWTALFVKGALIYLFIFEHLNSPSTSNESDFKINNIDRHGRLEVSSKTICTIRSHDYIIFLCPISQNQHLIYRTYSNGRNAYNKSGNSSHIFIPFLFRVWFGFTFMAHL